MELYGSEKPPAYDFSKISAPVAVYYAKDDHVAPYEVHKSTNNNSSCYMHIFRMPLML
jgi:poly(3-hydroxyalkanoate) synthetase